MSEISKVVEVPERLRKMADLFEERNRQYGNNFVTMGPVLHAMFPTGVRVETPDEWQRIFTIVMGVMKTTRYAQNLKRGGHQDSLDDTSVYYQMGAYTDDLARHQEEMAAVREVLSSVVVPPAETDLIWKLMSSGLSYVSTANMLGRSDIRARRSAWEIDVFIHAAGERVLSTTDLSTNDWEIWTSEAAPWRGTGGARSDGTA